jgi:hypothetical protein
MAGAAGRQLDPRGEPDGDDWRFSLPGGHAEALLDTSSLSYVTPFSLLMVASLRPIDALLAAYRAAGRAVYRLRGGSP